MKVSIITVVLNGIKTIERTIRSIIEQDYSEIEYIIIDGGSTDGTLDIIKKYENQIAYWISEPDKGIYNAMNKALQYATGEYINFINSDDWLEKNAVKKVMEYARITHPDVLYGDYYRVSENGLKILQTARPLEYIYVGIPFCHQSTFVHKNNKLEFDEEYRIAADYKMLLELYVRNKRFQYVPHPISNFSSGGMADKNQSATSFEMAMIAANVLIRSDNNIRLYGPTVLNNLIGAQYGRYLQDGSICKDIMKFIDKRTYKSEIVIFGVGDIFNKFRSLIQRNSRRIKYIIDNDEAKKGTTIDGIKVYLPSVLTNENDLSVIILNERYNYEMKMQLEGMNLSPTIRIFDYNELKTDYRKNMDKYIIDSLCAENSIIRTFINKTNEMEM